MTLRLTEAEARALRRRAEHEGRPMQFHIAERSLGHAPEVRDYGLLESAAARLALAAVIAFLGMNGRRLTLTNDQAYELVMDVAAGQLDSVEAIAAR